MPVLKETHWSEQRISWARAWSKSPGLWRRVPSSRWATWSDPKIISVERQTVRGCEPCLRPAFYIVIPQPRCRLHARHSQVLFDEMELPTVPVICPDRWTLRQVSDFRTFFVAHGTKFLLTVYYPMPNMRALCRPDICPWTLNIAV